jgi:hypothetical protein
MIMRTQWFLLPLLAGGTGIASAEAPSLRVGVTAGVNQAHINGSGASNISNLSGGMFGAYAVLPMEGDWSLQAGAQFSVKGWQYDEPGTRDLSVVKLNYVEIPLLLRYDFARTNRTGAFIYGGPGIGFRTGCALSATTHSTGVTQHATCAEVETMSNGSVKFNSLDAGAIGGLGARFGVGRAQLVVTAQYELGLRTVMVSDDSKNRALTLGAGFELPIHRK